MQFINSYIHWMVKSLNNILRLIIDAAYFFISYKQYVYMNKHI